MSLIIGITRLLLTPFNLYIKLLSFKIPYLSAKKMISRDADIESDQTKEMVFSKIL